MSEYQVIARKWRPQRFADVVGQEHVVKTLKNAIRQQRTAHAYLFVGPRGIGKTTTARIFAKALNCEAPEDGEPCCKCRSCASIAAENNIDVIEIDAASQNSVDNVRDLRDEILHLPVSCRYKIYIIDEVHMLSKNAWNALLKTVEEPPAHVKFIFATTEVHLVLPTIISRCQRFDLKPIPTGLIAARLAEIAAAEKVTISPGALTAIARAAAGGMRDAQSLLDQMIAFFGGNDREINEEQVLSLFGLAASTELEKIVRAMLNNDRGGVVASIHALAAEGKNLETLFSDLLNYLRGIQLCQLLSNPEAVLEHDPENIRRFRDLGENINPNVIQLLMENLSAVGRVLHDAVNKQVFLETIILKAMRLAHSVKIEDLIARLNYLRQAGELKFLDQLPAAAPPSAKTAAVPAAPVPEPAANPRSASEPVPPPEAEFDFEPMPEPEPGSDELTPNGLWQRIIKFIKSDHLIDPTIAHYMNEGSPQSFDHSLLTVFFYEEFDPSHYAAVKKIMPSIHKAIQKITGDWAAAVELVHKEGVRAVHNEVPEPEPEPEELESSEDAVPAEPGGEGLTSIMADKETVEAVKKKEIVNATLDLFGGTIVDIHG
ncbi:MAG: DNA polymerase III subunit gamma/tau [Victivallaceae bacterium]|nr:DNA polymerase III subunit gamma/tau [Victivallaceae bacterium]